jgi:hypothetical protein
MVDEASPKRAVWAKFLTFPAHCLVNDPTDRRSRQIRET